MAECHVILPFMSDILQIDRAGRVVIPKTVRDRYGLTPGRRLELIDTDGELRLRPEGASSSGVVRNPDGSVEFTGYLPPDFDWNDAIAHVREARLMGFGRG
jgi:AbrB family looped-hinge helix DNA binding protein